MEYKKSRWENEYDKYNANKDELNSKIAQIKREQATLKEGPEYASKKKELEELKKTQVKYDRIGKNKDKIENILKFKTSLVNKTSEILNKKAEIEKHEQLVGKCEQAILKLDVQRQEILSQIQKIDIKLKDPNLKDEDRAKLQEERESKKEAVRQNDTKWQQYANKKDEVNKKLESFDKDKINGDLLKNEQLIGKCDLIGAGLVKGKSMEDISASLSNFKFTPNKDFAKKIQAMRDLYDKSNENKEQEEKTPEEKEGKEKGTGEKIFEGNEPEGKPVPVSDFDQKHPRLAKIKNFFKNAYTTVKDKISNIINKGEKEEQKDSETIHDDNEKQVEDKNSEKEMTLDTDKDFEFAMKHLEGKDQDKVLEAIAEKGTSGFRESIKIDKKQQLENMRKVAAQKYAEKYGGKYEKQDGADLENKEDEGR